MRYPKVMIAAIAIAAAAGISGIAAAVSTGSSAATSQSSKTATIHAVTATVNGKAETILVDTEGLPLYYYKPDTPTKSFVSGTLAALWPPLVSSRPTITGASGKVSVTHDANGDQVAYNGHFLYTFVNDGSGHVSGQGVQNFFVATPALAVIGGASTSATNPASAPGSGTSYGY